MKLLPILTACFVWTSGCAIEASAAGNTTDHFRGRDDRVKLDSLKPPLAAIGRINLGGGRQFCTGVLVAPDRVLTAAHCLTDRRTKRPFRPGRIHFVAGQRRNTYLDHAPASCVRYLRGRTESGNAKMNGFIDDAAVIVLARSLNVQPTPLASPYFDDPGPLSHPAYSNNRPYLLSVHSNCSLLKKSRGIWLTDCDTSYGSSGGPVFVENGKGPELAAIMSGITQQGQDVYSIALPITLWARLIEDAKCSEQ